LHCPECLVNYNVLGYGAGRRATCPRCETRLIVPVATAIDAVDTMILGHVEPVEGAPIETFGRYLLFEEIGNGELGITYKAWDTNAGRLVALKRIAPVDAAVGEDTDRIVEGSKASIGLRHPCIAEVFEVGDVEGDQYIVAKFVEGIPLSKLIQATSLAVEPPIQLTPRNIAEVARRVAEALSVAHHSDVLHHDLKPSNILLDPDGMPHVTDFALAIDRRPSLGDPAGHWQRPILGTFPYIAPECALDEAPIGPAADVFSLGVVMYEALTGKTPFPGETPDQVLYAITKSDPEPPSKWALNLPRDLERIVMKAITRDPGERYADGAALASDLARFVNGESLDGEEPMVVEPVEERPRPRPVSERRPLRSQPVEQAPGLAEPPRAGRGKLIAAVLLLALAGGGAWAWFGPVQDHLIRKAADEALDAGNLDVALEKYKALEARGVSDPEAATKRQECERRIAVRQAADADAATKQAAHDALGQARTALEAARGAMRQAVQDNAPARAAEGVQKAREAAGFAEQAVAKDPDLVEGLVVRVQALALAGDADAAREAAGRIAETDGRRAGAIPSLLAVELRPLLAARGPLTEVVSPAPGLPFTRKLPEPAGSSYKKRKEDLRSILNQLTEPGDLARPLSAGVAALLDGNAATAAEELGKVAEMMPEEASFQLALAVAFLGTGEGKGALKAADAVLALHPGDALALWARSAALGALGRPEAERARDLAIEADRKLGHAQLDAAAAHLAAGRHMDALDDAQTVLAEHPEDPRALLLSARARRDAGLPDAALNEIEKALDAAGEFHAARLLRGDLLRLLGRTEEAVKELEGCVEKAPDDLEAVLALGRALVARKDPTRAIPMLNRVIMAAGEWPEPYGVRAEAKLLAKDL
ncbi:MAG: protein kinase, partial [Planctomycetota bacterium]